MTNGMWNPSKTGILTHGENGGFVFIEGGPVFDELKETAVDWVEPLAIEATEQEIADFLAHQRASMPPISPLQGILTLGEVEWGKVLAFRDGVGEDGESLATWQQKVIIDQASDWVRTSQNIAFFGFLLGYTDAQMDTLFIAAAQVRA